MSPEEYFRLNPEDARIRHRWLMSAIGSYFIFPAWMTLLLSFLAIVDVHSFQILIRAYVPLMVLFCIIYLPSFLILVHCAYKKFGVCWLFLSMIGTVIWITGLLFSGRIKDCSVTTSLIGGSVIAISLLYFDLSLKLIKINNRVSFEISDESQPIKEQIFSKTMNFEELDSVLGALVCRWPQHGSAIKSLVEKRRKQLQQQSRFEKLTSRLLNI